MNDAPAAAPGFHGKLPAKGDFVTRRLPRSLLDPWDRWLQDVVGDSRGRMGEAWLEVYLTSPVWRFVLGPGACGERACAGVLMPSVDRVGRYFPLTILAPLADAADLAGLPVVGADWFDRAEALARSALDDGFDFERFDAAVAALGLPPGDGGALLPAGTDDGLCLQLPAADALDPVYRALAGRWLCATYPQYSLWWTSGSEQLVPSFVVCAGLPGIERFGAFLDGRWDHWGWTAPAPAAAAAPA